MYNICRKCLLHKDYWMIDLITMEKIKSKAILLYLVNSKKLYDKKT